jgi:ribosomal protein S18 acetylase RimI-like enzyme
MNSRATDRGGDVMTAERLRDAHVEDAASIEAVHYASREAAYRSHVSQWPPDGPGRAERVARWARWLANEDIHCIVAERNDELVGFVTVRGATDNDLTPEDVAEMPTLYIAPEHWRSGLGTVLCRAALERARELGFEALVLWVLEINRRARAFYASLGFQPDGASRIDPGTREAFEAHRYRLELRDPTA